MLVKGANGGFICFNLFTAFLYMHNKLTRNEPNQISRQILVLHYSSTDDVQIDEILSKCLSPGDVEAQSSEMIMIYYLLKFGRCFDLIYLFNVRQFWCWFILIRLWWCNQSWPNRSIHFTRIDLVDSPRFSLCTFVLPCITIRRTVRRFIVP